MEKEFPSLLEELFFSSAIHWNATGKKIMVKDEEDTLLLETETILYLEAQNQDIRIVTSTGEYLKCYNIKDYEKELQECFFVSRTWYGCAAL